jgi:AcrR family transcriptional regulator
MTMSRERVRPTRDETRQRLFEAAAAVFVERGIGAASIEDICRQAGLTRGALYSNFENKDELVLAMLDDHLDDTIAETKRLMAMAADPTEYLGLLESDQRRREGPLGSNPVLYMEFILYALRDPSNRPRLVERQRRLRELIATIVRRDVERLGRPLPMPIEDAAELILALDDGYSLHELIEPGTHTPGTFSKNMLVLQRLWASAPEQPTPTRPVRRRSR